MENRTVFTEERLTGLLRDATGIDDVKPGPRPLISATVMLDTAIGPSRRSGSAFRKTTGTSRSSLGPPNSSGKPKPCTEPAGRSGPWTSRQTVVRRGGRGPTYTQLSGILRPANGSTRQSPVTWVSLSTSSAGRPTICVGSPPNPTGSSGAI